MDNINNIGFDYSKLLEKDLKNNKKEKEYDKILSIKNKSIKKYENYLVDIMGNVYSIRSKKYLKPLKRKGYLYVTLSNNGSKQFSIHRLVMETFIENKENKPIINHINSDKGDNRLINLEWVTHKENNEHMVKQGNNLNKDGINNHMSKLTEKEVVNIYKSKLSAMKLSSIYGVNVRQIYRIKNKERWKSILNKLD